MKKIETKKTKNEKDEKPSACHDDDYQEGIGQGELYSPEHAIKIAASTTSEEEGNKGIGVLVGDDMRRNLSFFKEKFLEKLSAASVPKETLENARQGIERVIREVSLAARGLTMDALHRIRSNLADLLPGVQKSKLNMMVDDAEKEAIGASRTAKGDGGKGQQQQQQAQEQSGKAPYMAPTSSAFFSSIRHPQSRL